MTPLMNFKTILCIKYYIKKMRVNINSVHEDLQYRYGKVFGSENEGEDLVEGANRLGVLKRKILLRRDQKARSSGEVSGF